MPHHESKRNLDVEAGLYRQRRRRFAKCKEKGREKTETDFITMESLFTE